MIKSPLDRLSPGHPLTLAGAVDGAQALALSDLARSIKAGRNTAALDLVVICRDSARLTALMRSLNFFAPDFSLLAFPSWDCLPYDRVSPHPTVVAQRMLTLSRLARVKAREQPSVLLTTVNAVLQRVPPKDVVAELAFSAAPGNVLAMDGIVEWLERNGYMRASTVREAGEYAVRGGIIDLFPPGAEMPVRLDFFGDTLESIRTFDAQSQRTIGQMRALDLVPATEFQLTTDAIKRFRQGYVTEFGAVTKQDPLYEAVSEGRRFAGMEHWLPLYHPKLDTLFDYAPDVPIALEPLVEDAIKRRVEQIQDYYQARKESAKLEGQGAPYKPLPPDRLYLTEDEFAAKTKARKLVSLTPFASPDEKNTSIIDFGSRQGRNFSAERAQAGVNVFDAAKAHIDSLLKAGKRVLIALWSEGSRDRMRHVLSDHGLTLTGAVETWADAQRRPKSEPLLIVLGLETGFETADVAIVTEQDILGDRLVRATRPGRRAQDFIAEVTSLSAGDLVVHVEHGIGRFAGLNTIEVAGAPHDCLEIHYAGGAKLFLPVENIELLSRYGSEESAVDLDRLGGAAWQSRKAKLKARILEMAGELIKIAAQRHLRDAPRLDINPNAIDEFAAGFPYDETEDQQNAIDATLDDLRSGRPMDRLICGDVGFGKTEVALRAAFAVAMSDKQVALVVPTTLLARQHAKTFTERFRGFPLTVAQASRLVPSAELKQMREGLASGRVDIVIGTHAILGKAIKFKDLGLVIIDEEQHFGVAHKEKLKQLRAEVHVLTLTATPIPRTLQLALTGVRELSIIASPPVDRLSVRTFVTPFDPLIVREALLRERYRGGQAFYVCPRVEDLAGAKEFLDKAVPEVRVAVAHGQLSAGALDDVMTAFYDGKYDVLLSTTIIESGLDVPTANTLIVHRADMFGLAQMYQLRGRVGRSKTRAYAFFTLPTNKTITEQAEKRLKVLQSLDTLGAGFQLASHDLDIRGAGNLLGEEQSGHIKEVGFELYQDMLEEAIASLKAGLTEPVADRWSPQITIGTPVLIPEDYVSDLSVRLSLYRRLADIEDEREIDSIGAELVDRFGPAPEEVSQLLETVRIKTLCRRANVEKIDAGPKGAVLSFRDDTFSDPEGLVRLIRDQGPAARVRPDMKVVFFDDWERPRDRLKGATAILRRLVGIAERAKAA